MTKQQLEKRRVRKWHKELKRKAERHLMLSIGRVYRPLNPWFNPIWAARKRMIRERVNAELAQKTI